jgi:hypothetical protein
MKSRKNSSKNNITKKNRNTQKTKRTVGGFNAKIEKTQRDRIEKDISNLKEKLETQSIDDELKKNISYVIEKIKVYRNLFDNNSTYNRDLYERNLEYRDKNKIDAFFNDYKDKSSLNKLLDTVEKDFEKAVDKNTEKAKSYNDDKEETPLISKPLSKRNKLWSTFFKSR